MSSFICLLRGINVGGKRPIKMEALRGLFEEAGARNVRTYIQSGNVVFDVAGEALPANFEDSVSQKIETTFSFSVPLLFIKGAELEQLSTANPYLKEAETDATSLHLTLFKEAVSADRIARYEEKPLPATEAVLHTRCAYLCCPAGYYNFKGSNAFWEKVTGTQATTRNWKTAQKLVEMSISTPKQSS